MPLKSTVSISRTLLPAIVAATSLATARAEDTTPSPAPSLDGEVGPRTTGQLQEVVVTAQKKSESLLEVPVPVSAVSAQSLVENNQVKLEDYYTQVPGLNLTPSAYGAPQLSIRGLSTGGFTNPTVAVTVDDVPYGSSSGIAYGQEAPNIDPSDLQRVEVLRGPQGTLYGASSLGGLLKYVTVDPSTAATSGLIQAGTSDIHNGTKLGYNLRAAVNVPLSDTLAVRVSGFVNSQPGYIDNILTGQRGINSTRADGGLFAARWMPNENLSLKLTALLQHLEADGVSEAYAGLPDLEQTASKGSGISTRDTQAYSATVKARLGAVDVTATSGFSVKKFTEWADYTSLLGPATEEQFGVSGTPLSTTASTRKFTQEIRFSVPIGTQLEWLFGAFYNHESSPATGTVLATEPATGAVVGEFGRLSFPSTYSEYAAFTDFTFHFTDRFDVQVGGRESHNRQTYSEYDVGPYVPIFEATASPFVYPEVHTEDSSFTYLVTPQYKISPGLMVYARVASGYRPGGPNIQGNGLLVPREYKPDKTDNFEAGLKGDFLEHTLAIDASVYYIKWKDIQLQLVNPISGIFYYTNGSEAKSQGLELSVQAKPWAGLSAAGWIAWNDAKMTEPMPADSSVIAASGDRLPYSQPFSANLSIEQSFALAALSTGATGFFGASASFTDHRVGQFASVFAGSSERQDLGAYTRLDLRTGVDYGTWRVNLYANNVTDKRGVLDGGLDLVPTTAFIYIQPRTVGVSVSKTFGVQH